MQAGPFSGIRILDIGRFIAAPFCAAILADLGADVIRIEPIGGSDDRTTMPVSEQVGALYLQVNRCKRSLPMDLRRQESKQILNRLIERSDVVITNMPEKALSRIGLDYQSLRALNPEIIHTNVTAFGDEGPERDSIGFDGTGQAMSGALYLTGWPGKPVRSAVSFVDYGTSLAAAFGTVSALYDRQRTGKGQEVKASLLRTALMMTNPMLIEEALGTRTRIPVGNRSPIAAPSDVFTTTDGWVMVQVIGQDMFRRWVALVDRPELLDDPLYSDDMKRGENGESLSAIMQAWCNGKSSDVCLREVRAARIPGCRVLSPKEALQAPQAVQGGLLDWTHYDADDKRIPLVRPFKLGHSGGPIQRPAPPLGQGSNEILREIGYSDSEIEDFRKNSLIEILDP